MIAGPSEILVLADAAANPAYVAADLLSQAEHDRLATAVLVCDSEALAGAVSAELEPADSLAAPGGHRPRVHRQQRQDHHCTDMAEGVDIANEIAPSIWRSAWTTRFSLLNSIRNAGSIFWEKTCPRRWAIISQAEPHAAHAGDGALFQPAFRG